MTEKRRFTDLLISAGADPQRIESPKDDSQEDIFPVDFPQHIPDDSLRLQSGDELRKNLGLIEIKLRRAFTALNTEEAAREHLGFYTILHPSFWITLGNTEGKNLAEQYQDIHNELENRKMSNV